MKISQKCEYTKNKFKIEQKTSIKNITFHEKYKKYRSEKKHIITGHFALIGSVCLESSHNSN